MIFYDEIERIRQIQQNLEKIYNHSELFLNTMGNIQLLMKHHTAILKQLLADTEALYSIALDTNEALETANILSDELKIH